MIRITCDRKTLREISREYIESEEPDLSALVEVLAEDFLREVGGEADLPKAE